MSEFCQAGHPVTDREDYEQRVENLREWPVAELDIGECRACGSTISYPQAQAQEEAA